MRRVKFIVVYQKDFPSRIFLSDEEWKGSACELEPQKSTTPQCCLRSIALRGLFVAKSTLLTQFLGLLPASR
jgi:hypothetical protein